MAIHQPNPPHITMHLIQRLSNLFHSTAPNIQGDSGKSHPRKLLTKAVISGTNISSKPRKISSLTGPLCLRPSRRICHLTKVIKSNLSPALTVRPFRNDISVQSFIIQDRLVAQCLRDEICALHSASQVDWRLKFLGHSWGGCPQQTQQLNAPTPSISKQICISMSDQHCHILHGE